MFSPTTNYPTKECSGTAQLLLPLGHVLLTVHSRIRSISIANLTIEILPTQNKPIQKEELIELLQPGALVKIQLSPDEYDISISSQEFKIEKIHTKLHQHLEVLLSCQNPDQEYKDFIYEIT